MLKPTEQMTEEELLETYAKACSWTIKRMQVTDTGKNRLGELYNHDLFMLALKKIEKLENEMKRKGVEYKPGGN